MSKEKHLYCSNFVFIKKETIMELKTFYKIRFNDCDSFKHLNNSGYIDYMLNAREDHLKEFHDISMTYLYSKGSGWMVNKHEIIYLNPANYGEQVCIKSNLMKYGNDSLLVEMTMWDENETHIKAILWTKFTHINLLTGKRDNHPEWFEKIAIPLENSEILVSSLSERLKVLMA
ncbi:acyl-CoA thioesterase [Flavobacterium alkalisoli]|uniref:Acyl-CoA thioesterase n=2 Tax=Flavobacterium alkalisoli TaxID=2602769 RepID=A0A5B9FU52_9FLAO|nr:acyl-CoA thioesterase [Flavobacterium alkalisoli]QEE50520.1 acyl-CoA thioesterase [Flavobacterium alkalisoli]